MTPYPLRLLPGDDLRGRLSSLKGQGEISAAFVIAGIGSLSRAEIRYAGVERAHVHTGDLELICLSGSLTTDGAHLHAAIADAAGRVYGGHVGRGCIVRTTAEILIAALPGWTFRRSIDAATGYAELEIIASG